MALCGVTSGKLKALIEVFKSFHKFTVTGQELKVCKIVSSSLLQKEHNGEGTL